MIEQLKDLKPKFKVYDEVEKVKGYKWPGTVVSVFLTLKKPHLPPEKRIRYVVECTVPEVAGALHIYSEAQIERRQE